MSIPASEVRQCCDKCGQLIPVDVRISGLLFVGRDMSFRDKQVQLSLRERQVMEMLVSTYPKPCHPERIFAKLWSERTSDKILHVYICNLRKKLPHVGMSIENVYGVGYQLVVDDVAGQSA